MIGRTQNLLSTLLLAASSANAARSLNFDESSIALNGSLYESTLHEGFLYLTSSVGRPPVNESYLFKVDTENLKLVESKSPGYDNSSKQLWAVYGIAADHGHGNIWTTNTRQKTVSVYNSTDLSLIKHLQANISGQTRDVVIHERSNKAYVSTSTASSIEVFDTNILEHTGSINLASAAQNFSGVMALDVDETDNELFTVSLSSEVAARVDLTNNDITYFKLGNDSQRASAVAYDRSRKHLFVASQKSADILVVNTTKGATGQSKVVTLPRSLVARAAGEDVESAIHVQAGGLSAAYDPTYDVVYVANRVTAEVYVIDADSLEVISTLKTGKFPNHITIGPNGSVFVLDKDTPSRLHRYVVTNSTGNATTTSPEGGAGAPGATGAANSTGGAGGAAGSGAKASGSKGGQSGSSGTSAPKAGNGATRAALSAAAFIVPVAAFLI